MVIKQSITDQVPSYHEAVLMENPNRISVGIPVGVGKDGGENYESRGSLYRNLYNTKFRDNQFNYKRLLGIILILFCILISIYFIKSELNEFKSVFRDESSSPTETLIESESSNEPGDQWMRKLDIKRNKKHWEKLEKADKVDKETWTDLGIKDWQFNLSENEGQDNIVQDKKSFSKRKASIYGPPYDSPFSDSNIPSNSKIRSNIPYSSPKISAYNPPSYSRPKIPAYNPPTSAVPISLANYPAPPPYSLPNSQPRVTASNTLRTANINNNHASPPTVQVPNNPVTSISEPIAPSIISTPASSSTPAPIPPQQPISSPAITSPNTSTELDSSSNVELDDLPMFYPLPFAILSDDEEEEEEEEEEQEEIKNDQTSNSESPSDSE